MAHAPAARTAALDLWREAPRPPRPGAGTLAEAVRGTLAEGPSVRHQPGQCARLV
ncbi:hypothetical protein GCM10010347_17160 [Streptomyces cirratus]|uniref:Uncharacterized protein n=1 Tax=Streptomyces cirratus TaxID=68187 RepID=A0ABQ3EN58_9ACTN|nr:hypothetical protein [Streptomyces cirratus]GHB47944.1 hypothetical protein GCM10010347_17160 [Streptomyces cirratus]